MRCASTWREHRSTVSTISKFISSACSAAPIAASSVVIVGGVRFAANRLRRLHPRDGEPATLEDIPRRCLALDFDRWPDRRMIEQGDLLGAAEIAEIVTGLDGFVVKYMGDGVLIYFGYPQAHEDDPERAIRAGLGAIDAVGRLDIKSTELQVRVGIATGVVVVGDLIGKGSAQEQAVVGETPNLAARPQALAAPNLLIAAQHAATDR